MWRCQRCGVRTPETALSLLAGASFFVLLRAVPHRKISARPATLVARAAAVMPNVVSLLPLLLFSTVSASSSGSGSSSASSSASGSSGVSAQDEQDCRYTPLSELQGARGLSDIDIFTVCNAVCPMPTAADLKTTCDDKHTYHAAYDVFRDQQNYHTSMQWCAAPARTKLARHGVWVWKWVLCAHTSR